MKKTLALVLCLVIAFTLILAGCNNAADEDAGYKVLEESLAAEEYGIAFRKGDVLCDEVNNALKVLKAEGKVAEVAEKWFGTDITVIEADAAALDAGYTEGRTLKVGLDDSFPPMGYRDDNNEIVGFDIDLAKAVCEYLGWEVEFIPIDWNAKEMELNSGNIDCIWNGMTLTQERIDAMSCSAPYLKNEQVLVVKADSDIATLADLAGKNIALQAGSSAEDALKGATELNASIAAANTFADNMLCFMDLNQGASDAVLVDSIVANWYIASGQAASAE
ncbi:MAG: transporter substrate-binding domain-containing protein [Ruminococcaceae bacterium]|nr:transporter substrate-binding domain-containing protein [Oscillospiraceae bacterium]